MVSEAELEQLSWPDAPKIVTGVPGPRAQQWLSEADNVESMIRGGGRAPVVFEEGYGVTVKDPDGNLFIDITAGVAVNSVGRRHPRVVKAMMEQAGKLMHGTDASNVRRTELAKKVSGIMPKGLKDNCIAYFTQSGSGAVETAIKFAHRITRRDQIVAYHGAYHGIWCGSGALTTGEKYHQGWGPLMPYVIHVPYPYCYRCPFGKEYPACDLQCARYVDYVLNTPYTGCDDVAALIIEPQQGEGGYLPPPEGYLEMIKEACVTHGALFIADEVQAGTGRTGKMWSIEYSTVEPDILTFGKGMGGDMPMAGLCLNKKYADKFIEGSQPGTFAGNAVISATSMTNIDILTEDDCALVKRAGILGNEIMDRLKGAAKSCRLLGDVRGHGLMIGIELVEDKGTREPASVETMGRVMGGLLNGGIIMVPCGRYGNVLRFMPSLTISREYAMKATDILIEVLSKLV